MKSLAIVTPASAKPVNLADLKAYARIDGTEDDTLLLMYIDAATDAIERYCGRKFINTVLELTLDSFPAPSNDGRLAYVEGVVDAHIGTVLSGYGLINLPCPPIVSVASVKTFDKANTESTYSSANYTLDKAGRIYLNDGATWPTEIRSRAGIKVTYTAGYGVSASDVPAPIRQAIMMHANKMYDDRCDCDLSASVKSILAGFKLYDGFGYEV